MRSKVTLLNTAEIDAIDSAVEFPNCLETFGSYGDWSREKLTHLLNKAKEVRIVFISVNASLVILLCKQSVNKDVINKILIHTTQ